MRTILLGLLTLAALSAQNTVVIQNGIIHTVTKGTITGSVVIVNGKITEVGEKVMTPAGAKIVDASGKHVIPGIIDCHTHIAVDAINEGSVSVSSMVGVDDVVNNERMDIYRALAGGVTTANVLHGSANAIGGRNVVLKMRWGKDADGLVFKEAKPGLKMALGENPKRQGMQTTGFGAQAGQQNLRYPGTRMGVEDVIREAFTNAKEYQKEWKDYEAKKAKGEMALPPRRDLQLETLVEVLEGKRLVHAHCYRADEILMLLRVSQEFGFKIATLQHVLEGYKVAKEIAAAGVGASTFSDWWSYKVEAYDAIPYNAAVLQKKGVLVSLNSDDAGGAELMRRLNTEAGKIMKYGGMTEDEALAMITINPAKQLGIDQLVGSIEAGKQADLVIYDKDPLSIFSKVEKVFIDGQQYFDRDGDMSARPRKEAEKKGLLEKEKETDRRNAPQTRRPS
ncbi:amidohydrolase [Paludibaculum fermentans]|uniref:Amidohydrolase n=1 Tax=Paludibaculum fermentans TaxID=1473598 RepID=A0A7S7NLD1_PALFE|nr:amidohydrolase [Paludibaculum fermentans]QOY85756.1 amidohydrolase [Paludibaculum fermentans]